MGVNALRWILANVSKIIASPAGLQYLNELVERTWRTLVQMTREYMTCSSPRWAVRSHYLVCSKIHF